MDGTAIDWLTETVLQAEAGDEPIEPAALTLLLRRYPATGREDIRDALGRGLARALNHVARPFQGHPEADPKGPHYTSQEPSHDPAGWLMLFSDASTLTDDERMPVAVGALVTKLRREWPARGRVRPAMRSVDACLAAAPVLESEQAARDLIATAIDEMERMVGRIYRPGELLARSLDDPDEPDGELLDHVETASALLTAHAMTGRLPYSMLAEELMRVARRTWWDQSGGFGAGPTAESLVTACEAARLLCRLALLHEDEEYRAAAVIATDSDYLADAERTLASLVSSYREYGIAAAIYGVALDELLVARGSRTS